MTYTPSSFFAAIFRSSSAKRYGGIRSRRSLCLTQCLQEFLGQLAPVDGDGPAGQVDVQVIADVDLEVAAVEMDGNGAVEAAQDGGHRRAAGAGAGRHRLPHPALE